MICFTMFSPVFIVYVDFLNPLLLSKFIKKYPYAQICKENLTQEIIEYPIFHMTESEK